MPTWAKPERLQAALGPARQTALGGCGAAQGHYTGTKTTLEPSSRAECAAALGTTRKDTGVMDAQVKILQPLERGGMPPDPEIPPVPGTCRICESALFTLQGDAE